VEIIEGLQAGETVVKDGAFLLKSDVLREKMGAGCAD
jgi:cobalt-zinc-cadmium efflux system membrane fusion protein